MNLADLVILAVIAAAVFFAARRMWKNRKRGSCSCGCEGCDGCRK